MGLNLWDPATGMAVPAILLTALLLGIVHGITPDEHTWPITFSYAIGSYSTRRGLLSGVLFSAAFTLQRAIACVLAYLALASWMQSARVDAIVYVVVGAVMALAGVYILRLGRVFHLHLLPSSWSGGARHHHWPGGWPGGQAPAPDAVDSAAPDAVDSAASVAAEPRAVTPWMALAHGFIAGWGFGAFASILYTTLAPAMPSAALAWMPGVAFGLGTLIVQAAAGAAFGAWMRRHELPEWVIARVARQVAGTTLLWGGIAFALAGIISLLAPALVAWQVTTPIQIHNLRHLGLGFVLVVVVVMVIGLGSLARALRQARRAAEVSL